MVTPATPRPRNRQRQRTPTTYCSCRVQNLQHALCAVDFHLFAVRILDGGVVLRRCFSRSPQHQQQQRIIAHLLHEDSLNELHGDGLRRRRWNSTTENPGVTHSPICQHRRSQAPPACTRAASCADCRRRRCGSATTMAKEVKRNGNFEGTARAASTMPIRLSFFTDSPN